MQKRDSIASTTPTTICRAPLYVDTNRASAARSTSTGNGDGYRGYIDDRRRGPARALRVAYDDGEKKYHVLQDEPVSGDGTPPTFDETAGDPEPFRFVPTPQTARAPVRDVAAAAARWACVQGTRAHPCRPPGACKQPRCPRKVHVLLLAPLRLELAHLLHHVHQVLGAAHLCNIRGSMVLCNCC